jgi:hypothetical protein
MPWLDHVFPLEVVWPKNATLTSSGVTTRLKGGYKQYVYFSDVSAIADISGRISPIAYVQLLNKIP